jgi:hypothetical protein
LRRGAGVFLALQWNLPVVLLFWHPWRVFLLVIAINCFLWSIGCYLTGRYPRCRALLFRPSDAGVSPHWKGAAVLMAVYGIVALIIRYFEC